MPIEAEGQPDISTAGATVTPSVHLPTIYNVSLPVANIEVSQALSSNVRKLLIRNRNIADIKFSFVSGESGTKYTTIPRGAALTLNNMNLPMGTIYMQSPKAGQLVEILEWA